MGREIRRVPANWEHPRYTEDDAPYNPIRSRVGEYIALHDDYQDALAQFEESIKYDGLSGAIENWGGGPLKSRYVDFDGKPADWWQVYETVSEGTPVSPPFATQRELADYLIANGDFWDQKRRTEERYQRFGMPLVYGWSREAAEKFVFGDGWAPSFMIVNGTPMSGVEGLTVKP